MRNMKDSGVEWIGDIPEDWKVGKVKEYYKLQIGFTPDTKNELYYDNENGYDWVTISDLKNDKFVKIIFFKHLKSIIKYAFINLQIYSLSSSNQNSVPFPIWLVIP